jgi:hypothetical protein
MRALFSLVALVVVVLIVMKLAGRQAEEVARPDGAKQRSEQIVPAIQKALEQGAAARASEAAAQ